MGRAAHESIEWSMCLRPKIFQSRVWRFADDEIRDLGRRMDLTIVPLGEQDERVHGEVAELLHMAFAEWPESWPTLEAARAEVAESLASDRISLVASNGPGVVGWVGGISSYHGRVWELHPLAVAPRAQGAGVGRELVLRLEREVAARGGLTLYLGTDDVTGLTTLGGIDLYPGVLAKAAGIRNLRNHPFGFYLRVGFEVVGVVPDANGFGRPDIMMAKRIIPTGTTKG